MTIKAFIFDFDGVILDTESSHYKAWQELYQQYGIELPFTQWIQCLGTTDDAFNPLTYLENRVNQPFDRQIAENTVRKNHLNRIEREPVMAGIKDYLIQGKATGIKNAVASSSSLRWVGGHLDRLLIRHYFDCLCTNDDVANVKPDPALYLCALERLGVTAAEAVAFEDSPHGITAARTAGIFTVAIRNPITANLNVEHANLVIDSLSTLPFDDLIHRAS